MRKSQHTYGIGVLKPFIRGNHPRGKYRERFDAATIIDIVTSMTSVLVGGYQWFFSLWLVVWNEDQPQKLVPSHRPLPRHWTSPPTTWVRHCSQPARVDHCIAMWHCIVRRYLKSCQMRATEENAWNSIRASSVYKFFKMSILLIFSSILSLNFSVANWGPIWGFFSRTVVFKRVVVHKNPVLIYILIYLYSVC